MDNPLDIDQKIEMKLTLALAKLDAAFQEKEKALTQLMDAWWTAKQKDVEKQRTADDQKAKLTYPTRFEVQKVFNVFAGQIAKANDQAQAATTAATIAASNRDAMTDDRVKTIVRSLVPAELIGLGTGAGATIPGTGNVLMRTPGVQGATPSAFWGDVIAGFNIKGTKTLYYVVAAREYMNSDGSLVAVGSETGGADRNLKPTWDVLRSEVDL